MQTLTGNYRLWGRTGRAPEDLSVERWGVGISIDQKFLAHVALFARYAVGRTEGGNDQDTAGSIGLAVYAPFRDRVRDHAGLGISALHRTDGTEKIVEGYYHLFVTHQFSLIGNVQWLIEGPDQPTGEENENLVIPGIRGTINF
jgi:carbohydrate-selective porin OprB